MLAAAHHCIQNARFEEIHLDFRNLKFASPVGMVAICAQIMSYRESGIYTHVVLPEESKNGRLFFNTNWAHYLDPRHFDPSRSRSTTRLPVTQYRSTADQHRIVDETVKAVLASIENYDRSEIGAFEWAINEITDNVLVHAESKIGGLVQVISYPRSKYVQFVVADAGLGIPATLRTGQFAGASDVELLDQAIREGVTRDKSVGQGNGLYGTFSICEKGEGTFRVVSRHASLGFDRKKRLKIQNEQIPFDGTLVAATLDFTTPGLLSDALKIGGRVQRTVDFLETHYEDRDSNNLRVKIAEEASSYGSRVAGTPIRKTLHNLINMADGGKVIVDFSDIALVSSSFADEVIGKLYVELGPIGFAGRVELQNMEPIVKKLIEKAIVQRTKTNL